LARRGFRCRVSAAGAFTLIEIMVVVGIIGLTLTIGVPAFVRALNKEGMRKAQSDLLEACKNARGAAILKGQPQALTFRPVEESFTAPGGSGATTLPPDVVIQLLGVNEVQFEREEFASVRFYPNGTSDEFTIVVHSVSDGSSVKISLDPVTALAELEVIR
jgi:prepilin-type N-terminal cleavage/methylation domain-containing protein